MIVHVTHDGERIPHARSYHVRVVIPLGTRSLLYGTHQFLWHPWTVARGWRTLYGSWPTWREAVCILIHDWGYWGKRAMDDDEGTTHPELGAFLAAALFGDEYEYLCLAHSRHYARASCVPPSRLCWADKMSIVHDPAWFYLLRARMSGELAEYRRAASTYVPLSASDHEWLDFIRARFIQQSKEATSCL